MKSVYKNVDSIVFRDVLRGLLISKEYTIFSENVQKYLWNKTKDFGINIGINRGSTEIDIIFMNIWDVLREQYNKRIN